MGFRRKRCREELPVALICIAFGAGIFLAMFCSLKLVVVLSAAFLVVLGLLSMNC